MPEINILALVVAALVPNVIGALYYGPVFGNIWLKSFGKTKAEMEVGNQALTYLGALLLSFVIAFFLNFIMQAVHKDVGVDGTIVSASFNALKHGAFHRFFLCLGFVVPTIVSLGLFHKYKPAILCSILVFG